VRGPLGGLVWHHLQYVLGLAALGHDVWFLEDSDDYPGCYDPSRDVIDVDPAYGLEFTARTFERVGLSERWAYHDAHGSGWRGPASGRAPEICRTAELLLDLSAINPMRSWFEEIPCRVLIDTDPAFTQMTHLADEKARARAAKHTAFFSFGENAGRAGCFLPDDGFPWQPTRQPVALDSWPVTAGPGDGPLTTVMQWDSYEAREHEGERYGMKSESLIPYVDMPARTGRTFQLALSSPDETRVMLTEKGWSLVDARVPTLDPWAYQRFIRESRAEFSVAKHGYVVSRSGWFSERSANYLASGRPVIVQDTGFTDWLRAEAGVLPFSDPEEAAARVEELGRDYAHQCRAARAVAEEYFDAKKVLPPLIEASLHSAANRTS